LKAIIGLGNPGRQYAKTRHNLGFLVVDKLASLLDVSFNKKECHAKTSIKSGQGQCLLLAKPLTFMNHSGQAVAALMKKYSIQPDEILIICDDLALPPGKVRIRAKGSAGGHKGLESVIEYMGTNLFPRLRIGIGPVPEDFLGADYVLSTYTSEEMKQVQEWVTLAVHACRTWLELGIDVAMSGYNQ
jgi:PTH1 family peptidyl-tRNA hydrolase